MTESQNINEIVQLIGDITDYASELSENETNKEDNLGSMIEKYFHNKIQTNLNIHNSYTKVVINIEEFLKEVVFGINITTLKKKLSSDEAMRIIDEIYKSYKGETSIEIDSLFPIVEGKEISKFLQRVKRYPENNIDENLKYTIFVESTHNLQSQIVKKEGQLCKLYMFFGLMKKFYQKNPDYLEDYYKYFINKYILRKKVEKFDYEKFSAENIICSEYGNYIFIIATNKNLKSFQEVEQIEKNYTLEEKEVEETIKKCFKDYKRRVNISLISQKKYKLSEKSDGNKKLTDPNVFKSYKALSYIIDKINEEDNSFMANIIYLDTYLNSLAPKSILVEKINSLKTDMKKYMKNIENIKKEFEDQKVQAQKEIKDLQVKLKEQKDKSEKDIKTLQAEINREKNKKNNLIKFLSEKFPGTDFSNF